jgi:hypothetical protein
MPIALQLARIWLWIEHDVQGAGMFRNRLLAVGVAALAAGLASQKSGEAAQQGATVMTCTNPVSGTSWQVLIDYRQATVDSNPARITRDRISWFDPKDGSNYMLDRRSGDLTATVASSTGGYFRHARCSLGKPP